MLVDGSPRSPQDDDDDYGEEEEPPDEPVDGVHDVEEERDHEEDGGGGEEEAADPPKEDAEDDDDDELAYLMFNGAAYGVPLSDGRTAGRVRDHNRPMEVADGEALTGLKQAFNWPVVENMLRHRGRTPAL
eukprot:3227030-Prymnesium_polylepis.1